MEFKLTDPCDTCPFRKDIAGYLTSERVKEICSAIDEGGKTFTCHKTTTEQDDGDGGEDMVDGPNAQHCAGALIFQEKLERPNQAMRIAERLRLYDHRKLNMKAPVFDSVKDFVDAQGKDI